MDNKTAVEIIKSNWPSERYSALRAALSRAIRALEREDRKFEKQKPNEEKKEESK